MNIVRLLNQVDSNDIVLPAIQRDFVWGKDKIAKLMDPYLPVCKQVNLVRNLNVSI